MSYDTILVEQQGAVTLVTLNRPQALNALNTQTLTDLIAAFAAYDADDSQRCLVLTGSGEKAFAAGADIKVHAGRRQGRSHGGGDVAVTSTAGATAGMASWLALGKAPLVRRARREIAGTHWR